ncbi:hypothetical protein M0R45_006031 [Rubus argutus]|uniref:CCHC-type domain-containing protein n=1 Tax=Rubus argutus TaxID=59490 RepID=A0AAW1YPV5_RUBAR
MDLPSFNGHLHIEDFLDWISEVERFFDYMDIQEHKKVKLVAYKLKGGASAWWEQLQLNRTRQGKITIRTWPRMKQLLRSRFLPPDYDQVLFQQYQNCRQGNRLVRDYAAEFYRLSARNDLSETEAQQVARFIGGLKPIIHDRVVLQPVYFLNDAVQLATKVEAQLERSNTRHPFSGKGILPTPDQIPPGRVAPRIDNLPTMASQDCESSKAKTSRFSNAKGAAVNPYAPPPPIKCYRCSQPGHRSNQCPSRQVNLATHGEENTVLQDENDVEDETEVTYEDEGISLVVRKLMYTPKQELNPQRHNIFQTRCTVNQRVCNLIIDGGSSENIVSKAMVDKLQLKTQPHPAPYTI